MVVVKYLLLQLGFAFCCYVLLVDSVSFCVLFRNFVWKDNDGRRSSGCFLLSGRVLCRSCISLKWYSLFHFCSWFLFCWVVSMSFCCSSSIKKFLISSLCTMIVVFVASSWLDDVWLYIVFSGVCVAGVGTGLGDVWLYIVFSGVCLAVIFCENCF